MLRTVSLALISLGLLALCVPAGHTQHRSDSYISTETNLVRIQAIVLDSKGAIANDLTDQNFRIVDDGQEQKIQYFSHVRQPVSVVLALDNSQSMKHKLPFVRDAAYSTLAPFPDEEEQKRFLDEFALICFSNRAEVVSPFTEGANLQPRIDTLIQPTENSTALFDSIYLAAETEQDAQNERRAIILVTDGGDNHSRHTLKQTERFLEEVDIPFFAVMAGDELVFPFLAEPEKEPKPRLATPPLPAILQNKVDSLHQGDHIGPAELRGPHNLKVVAETTGGTVFTAHRLENLERIIRTISNAVRYSYLIGYDPPLQDNAVRPKGWDGWHKVNVQLVPESKYRGYVVYARQRYYESKSLSQLR